MERPAEGVSYELTLMAAQAVSCFTLQTRLGLCLSCPGLVFISGLCSALLPAHARSLLRFSLHLICRILFSLRISSNFSQDIVSLSRFLCNRFFSASFSLNVGSVFTLCARYRLIFSAARFLFSLTAWTRQKREHHN